MKHSPEVRVECDECQHEEYFGVTPLGCDSFDCRNLEGSLDSAGWICINGNDYCCQECADEADK